MPLKWFRCPDGKTIETKDCLEKCRLGQRCITRTTLKVIADGEHVWDGVPHVTQLLNGTMLEYLRVTRDYVIDPRDRAFALLGSSHHKLLENNSVRGVGWGQQEQQAQLTPQEQLEQCHHLSELPLNNGWCQGTLDLLEQDSTELVLTDYKCWGSGKLAKADYSDVTLQLNMYRVMAEQQHGWHVDRLQVQCTVRDGGLAVAAKRGITANMLLIPIGMLQDNIVLACFEAKAKQLQTALEFREEMPVPCTQAENWNYIRCKSFCDVAVNCPVGIRVKG